MTGSRPGTWRIAAANGLQNAGDQIANAKTGLPWLLHQLGPGFLVGLLVTGLVSGGPAMPGGGWALLLLAAIGAAGVLAATALPEVSDRASRDG